MDEIIDKIATKFESCDPEFLDETSREIAELLVEAGHLIKLRHGEDGLVWYEYHKTNS